MANKYIKDLSENTNPDGTDAIEIDDGVNSEWVKINNLFDGAPSQGDVIYFNGTKWKRLAAGTNGDVLTTGGTGANPAWETPSVGGSGGDVIRTKYIITPSVATNDLTVAIKYIDGNDPTSTNKLTFRVGDTEYDLTAATSFTKNDGTNWCNAGSPELGGRNMQFFMYAIGETGASAGLKFGYSRIPYAKTMNDFVNTTTSEKYIAGNWTNFNSTDAVVNIGRFQAQLSLVATSYLWSIPTANVVNYPVYETDLLTWSPAWTNLTVGNGTQTATYKIISTLCDFNVDFVFGSTSSISGDVSHSTPIAGVGFGNTKVAGTLGIRDTGTAQYSGVNLMQSASLINFRAINAAGTYASQVTLASNIPHTWANTDEFHEWANYNIA